MLGSFTTAEYKHAGNPLSVFHDASPPPQKKASGSVPVKTDILKPTTLSRMPKESRCKLFSHFWTTLAIPMVEIRNSFVIGFIFRPQERKLIQK